MSFPTLDDANAARGDDATPGKSPPHADTCPSCGHSAAPAPPPQSSAPPSAPPTHCGHCGSHLWIG